MTAPNQKDGLYDDVRRTAGSRRNPVLIIVMGTSGSGKSTLGIRLADALRAPFVDGDDLHPADNVNKMASGHPLDDADRLPWLLAIRTEAQRICRNVEAVSKTAEQGSDAGHAALQPQRASNSVYVRDLAEAYETSQQNGEAGDAILHEARRAKVQGAEVTSATAAGDEASISQPASTKRGVCVIACSALKRNYRHLLRYGLHGSDAVTVDERADESLLAYSTILDVYHVYVRVSHEELLRRMHERKGHFMKESMLQSQLATLEEPDPHLEPRILILEDKSVEALVNEAKRYFDNVL